MLDPQTRQQLQTKFQQIKPQLKGQFSGLSDQDLDVGRSDPDTLIETISRKTGQGREQVEQTVRQLVTATQHLEPARASGRGPSFGTGPFLMSGAGYPSRSRAVFASTRPIASELVAAGDGALRTCRTRPDPPRLKSSTIVPSRPSACARTPDGPNVSWSPVISGT